MSRQFAPEDEGSSDRDGSVIGRALQSGALAATAVFVLLGVAGGFALAVILRTDDEPDATATPTTSVVVDDGEWRPTITPTGRFVVDLPRSASPAPDAVMPAACAGSATGGGLTALDSVAGVRIEVLECRPPGGVADWSEDELAEVTSDVIDGRAATVTASSATPSPWGQAMSFAGASGVTFVRGHVLASGGDLLVLLATSEAAAETADFAIVGMVGSLAPA